MKKALYILLAAALLCSCNSKKENATAFPLIIDSAELTYHGEKLDIDLSYPVFVGGAEADSINKAVVSLLKSETWFEDKGDSLNLPAFVMALIAEKPRVENAAGWELTSSWKAYQTPYIVSLEINRYIFTGGANGMQEIRCLNFDRRTGKSLSPSDIFTDIPSLENLNRGYFRWFLREERSSADSASLFVPIDSLPLPRNIGLDSVGAVMTYNLYEIAPRSFGPSVYTIPYGEIKMNETYKK